MLYPTIEELTQGKFNRYELSLATAKCARIVTDEYAKQKVNEHEITQEARKKSAELVAAAEQRAKEVMRAAGEYCEDAMKRTEAVLGRSLEELKQSHVQFRQAIREQENN